MQPSPALTWTSAAPIFAAGSPRREGRLAWHSRHPSTGAAAAARAVRARTVIRKRRRNAHLGAGLRLKISKRRATVALTVDGSTPAAKTMRGRGLYRVKSPRNRRAGFAPEENLAARR